MDHPSDTHDSGGVHKQDNEFLGFPSCGQGRNPFFASRDQHHVCAFLQYVGFCKEFSALTLDVIIGISIISSYVTNILEFSSQLRALVL